MSRPWIGFASLGLFVLLSCGGSVIVADDDAGPGGSGGSGGGVAGTGGGVAGTGGGVAGTGGGVAGTGGGVAGTGGGVAGTGGGVAGTGGTPVCPPIADCNWCGGKTVYDAAGCEVGYVCANGADPCMTSPCFGPEDCGPNQVCADMLCWGDSTVTCGEGSCGVGVGGGSQTCDCDWGCSDGNKYGFSCWVSSSGSYSCDCRVNGVTNSGCGMGGMAGSPQPPPDPCTVGDCCGFPQ
jgi:hypothetical protein